MRQIIEWLWYGSAWKVIILAPLLFIWFGLCIGFIFRFIVLTYRGF
jgi:hypothetical protein